jgi:hypothetical protein
MVAEVINQYFRFTKISRHTARFNNEYGSLFAAWPKANEGTAPNVIVV